MCVRANGGNGDCDAVSDGGSDASVFVPAADESADGGGGVCVR